MAEYVTRAEFEELLYKYNDLVSKLDSIGLKQKVDFEENLAGNQYEDEDYDSSEEDNEEDSEKLM